MLRRDRNGHADSNSRSGAALALLDWAHQLQHGAQTPLPGKKPYDTQSDLVKEVKTEFEKGIAKNAGKAPQVLIIGALGRCKYSQTPSRPFRTVVLAA